MSNHPVVFEQLIDWLDGRLDADQRQAVEAHLQDGCPTCEADLAFLRRVTAAMRTDDSVEPPAAVVARARAIYRPACNPRRAFLPWLVRTPRWAMSLAATLLVVVGLLVTLLSVPTVFARGAVIAEMAGTVETRDTSDGVWTSMARGSRLHEGEWVRVTGGKAVLVLFDGTRLELDPSSEIILSSLRSALFGACSRIEVSQPAGTVRYAVPARLGRASSFETLSAGAQMKVMSGIFIIAASQGDREAEVALLDGWVEVIQHHENTWLSAGDVLVVSEDRPARPGPTLTLTPGSQPAAVASATAEPSDIPGGAGSWASQTPDPGDDAGPTTAAHATSTPHATTAGPTRTPSSTRRPQSTATPHGERTPAPTQTGEPAATANATRTAEPHETRRPTETPRSGDTPHPSATAQKTQPPEPTQTDESEETPPPSGTPRPTETRPATSTSHPAEPPETDEPEVTPRPTRTPAPTGTHEFAGNALAAESATPAATPAATEGRRGTGRPTGTEEPGLIFGRAGSGVPGRGVRL